MTSTRPTFYRIRIDLLDLDPPVWRRVEVPGSFSLNDLDQVLLSSLSWEGMEPSYFESPEGRISDGEVFCDVADQDSRVLPLARLFPMVGAEAVWVYEEEEAPSWRHRVVLESIREGTEDEVGAGILEAERPPPPEHLGGPEVYRKMLAAHRRGDPVPEWDEDFFGGPFDPDTWHDTWQDTWHDARPRKEVAEYLFRHHHADLFVEIQPVIVWKDEFPEETVRKIESDPERYREVIRYMGRINVESWEEAEEDVMDLLILFGKQTTLELVPLYILAWWRDPELFPLLMQLSRLREESLYAIWRDGMLKDLPRMLAVTCAGRLEELDAWVCDEKVPQNLRCCAVEAFSWLYRLGEFDSEAWAKRLRRWMRSGLERRPGEVWNTVALYAAKDHPNACRSPLHMALLEKEWVSGSLLDWDEIDERARRCPDGPPPEPIPEDAGLIDPTNEAIGSWDMWEQEDLLESLFGDGELGDDFGMDPDLANLLDSFEDEDEDEYEDADSGSSFPDPVAGLDGWDASPPLDFLAGSKGSLPPHRRQSPKVGRNDPCPCGSGKKYKRCCGR